MRNDSFVTEMQAQGFQLHFDDFLVGPKVLTWHNDRPYMVRTNYELIEGRWEGFVSMERVDEVDPTTVWV